MEPLDQNLDSSTNKIEDKKNKYIESVTTKSIEKFKDNFRWKKSENFISVKDKIKNLSSEEKEKHVKIRQISSKPTNREINKINSNLTRNTKIAVKNGDHRTYLGLSSRETISKSVNNINRNFSDNMTKETGVDNQQFLNANTNLNSDRSPRPTIKLKMGIKDSKKTIFGSNISLNKETDVKNIEPKLNLTNQDKRNGLHIRTKNLDIPETRRVQRELKSKNNSNISMNNTKTSFKKEHNLKPTIKQKTEIQKPKITILNSNKALSANKAIKNIELTSSLTNLDKRNGHNRYKNVNRDIQRDTKNKVESSIPVKNAKTNLSGVHSLRHITRSKTWIQEPKITTLDSHNSFKAQNDIEIIQPISRSRSQSKINGRNIKMENLHVPVTFSRYRNDKKVVQKQNKSKVNSNVSADDTKSSFNKEHSIKPTAKKKIETRESNLSILGSNISLNAETDLKNVKQMSTSINKDKKNEHNILTKYLDVPGAITRYKNENWDVQREIKIKNNSKLSEESTKTNFNREHSPRPIINGKIRTQESNISILSSNVSLNSETDVKNKELTTSVQREIKTKNNGNIADENTKTNFNREHSPRPIINGKIRTQESKISILGSNVSLNSETDMKNTEQTSSVEREIKIKNNSNITEENTMINFNREHSPSPIINTKIMTREPQISILCSNLSMNSETDVQNKKETSSMQGEIKTKNKSNITEENTKTNFNTEHSLRPIINRKIRIKEPRISILSYNISLNSETDVNNKEQTFSSTKQDKSNGFNIQMEALDIPVAFSKKRCENKNVPREIKSKHDSNISMETTKINFNRDHSPRPTINRKIVTKEPRISISSSNISLNSETDVKNEPQTSSSTNQDNSYCLNIQMEDFSKNRHDNMNVTREIKNKVSSNIPEENTKTNAYKKHSSSPAIKPEIEIQEPKISMLNPNISINVEPDLKNTKQTSSSRNQDKRNDFDLPKTTYKNEINISLNTDTDMKKTKLTFSPINQDKNNSITIQKDEMDLPVPVSRYENENEDVQRETKSKDNNNLEYSLKHTSSTNQDTHLPGSFSNTRNEHKKTENKANNISVDSEINMKDNMTDSINKDSLSVDEDAGLSSNMTKLKMSLMALFSISQGVQKAKKAFLRKLSHAMDFPPSSVADFIKEGVKEWENIQTDLNVIFNIGGHDFSDLENLTSVEECSLNSPPPVPFLVPPPPPPQPPVAPTLPLDSPQPTVAYPVTPLPPLPPQAPVVTTVHCLPQTSSGFKTGTASRKTVKLHWKPITLLNNSSFWNSLPLTSPKDLQEITNLFEIKDLSFISKMSTSVKPKELLVLELKRSTEINIGIKKLPSLEYLKKAIMTMDSKAIDGEGIERLQTLLPSEEELVLIKKASAANLDIPLGKAEQFLLLLGNIPQLDARIKLWKFKMDFSNMERDICRPLATLLDGIEIVKKSVTFANIISVILAIGNILNKTNTIAFQLEYLKQLSSIKDTNTKKCLLYHVAKKVLKLYPESPDLYSEIAPFSTIAMVDFNELIANLENMEEECKKALGYIKVAARFNSKTAQLIKEFLSDSAKRIMSMKRIQNLAVVKYKNFLSWLGLQNHLHSDYPPAHLAGIFIQFASEYKDASATVFSENGNKSKKKMSLIAEEAVQLRNTIIAKD